MQLNNGSEVILARKQLTIIEQAYQDKDCNTDKLAGSVSELMSIYHQTKAAKIELEETLSQLRRGLRKIQSALNALDPSINLMRLTQKIFNKINVNITLHNSGSPAFTGGFLLSTTA